MYSINVRLCKYVLYELQAAPKASPSSVSQSQIKEPPSLGAMALLLPVCQI